MTGTPPPPPPAFGQTVGEAQRALGAVLSGILDQAGTTFESWVALNTLATRGPAIPGDALRRDLADGLQADPSAISALLARLESTGLVHRTSGTGTGDGARVELTGEGQSFHRSLRESIGRSSAELLDGIDTDDVATTIEVLRAVTERARARRTTSR